MHSTSMSSFYNDPQFSYLKYWQGREYEHQAEVLAIKRLLGKLRFTQIIDIGGGYGRLTSLISQYSKDTTLVEPSQKQRQIAKKQLSTLNISIVSGKASQTGLSDSSCDLVTMIRLLHHLPDLSPTFAEAARILKPHGYFLFEFANSLNFKARLTNLAAGRSLSTLPLERRRPTNIRRGSIPFVNHHPQAIFKLLTKNGFTTIQTLSVSNFRSSWLKKIIPSPILLVLESIFQYLFSGFYFGPSIFILARKTSGEQSRTIDILTDL